MITVTVAIPNRCEDAGMLQRTIDRAHATAGMEIDVVVVNDGYPPKGYEVTGAEVVTPHPLSMGTSRTRHEGVMAAKTDVVICIDGHMDWLDGSEWCRRIVEHLEANPRDITCCRCPPLDPETLEFQDHSYHGAKLTWCTEARDQYFVLAGQWANNTPGSEIGCLMGACYGMFRERYMEIGAPWQYGRAWGMDEETLSLSNWICGGRIWLLDLQAGHLFRSQRQVPYSLGMWEACAVWANRARLVMGLPMSKDLREELMAHVSRNLIVRQQAERIFGILNEMDYGPWVELLARQGRTMNDYIEGGYVNMAKKYQSKKELAKRARALGLKQASKCTREELIEWLREQDGTRPQREEGGFEMPDVITPGMGIKPQPPAEPPRAEPVPAAPPRPAQVAPPAPPEGEKTIKVVQPDICPRCDNVGTFITVSSHTAEGAYARVRRQKCRRCGHKRDVYVSRVA